MGLRFRQSFQIFPGVRLNLSGGGISATFGIAGASVNVGSRGTRTTIGIPGSGVSYTHHNGNKHSVPDIKPSQFQPEFRIHSTPTYIPPQFQMREINSASIEELTSHNLIDLRDMFAEARQQRTEIESDLREAERVYVLETDSLKKRQRSLFKFLMKKKIAELENSLPITQAEIDRLNNWLDSTHIDLKFDLDEASKKSFASLTRAFDALRTSAMIWDITSDRYGDRVIERSFASRTIQRTPVVLDFEPSELVRFEGRALRFGNVNGEPIIIYPGVAIMPRADGAFALIDLREFELGFQVVSFVEDEAVPADSEIIGYTWAKVNKDGSRDLRFKDNYQIPLARYGRISITSSAGMEEEYQFSNLQKASEFAKAFEAFKATL